MTPLRRCLGGIAISLVAIAAPALAGAQDHRPDAGGYPCTSRPKLAVRQDGQGFSIAKLDPAVPERIDPAFRTPTEIALGAALRIDRAIFMTNLVRMAGGNDARR